MHVVELSVNSTELNPNSTGHSLCTLCALSVHSLSTLYPLSVHSLSTLCPLSTVISAWQQSTDIDLELPLLLVVKDSDKLSSDFMGQVGCVLYSCGALAVCSKRMSQTISHLYSLRLCDLFPSLSLSISFSSSPSRRRLCVSAVCHTG